MKATLATILLTTSTLLAQETTNRTAPISGDDIAQILALQAQKELISFGKPKYVTLRIEASGQSKDFVLKELTASVTLLTYIPSEGGPNKSLKFWLRAESGEATHSYFAVGTSKTKFTKSEVLDGVYTIVASDSEDMKAPTYRMQILTSDTKP